MAETVPEPIALVTGGTEGIGRSVAEMLRADGFRTAVMARSEASLQAMAGDYITYRGDVGNPDDIAKMLDDLDRRFGRLDALVHCAAVIDNQPAAKLTMESINRQVQINLVGTIVLNHAALPLLRKARGAIVNFSTGILRHPSVGTSVYAATKGGVEAFSRSLAYEVALDGVRVNVVSPALVRSSIWTKAGMNQEAYDRMLENRGREYPLGRTGEPEDVAEVVRLLVSPRAAWMTGVVIPVDGGRALGPVKR